MDARTAASGDTVYVASDELENGSKGPFYRVYRDDKRDEPHGYLCSNCDTLDNAMATRTNRRSGTR